MAGNVSKYESHVKPYLDLVKSMRIDGYKEKDIHDVLEIGHNAWNKYKKEHEELREALKISKETLIAKLEQTMFQQALDGNSTLLIFALKNLAPQKWADKTQIDTTDLKDYFEELKAFKARTSK
jgi:hypothetical protein